MNEYRLASEDQGCLIGFCVVCILILIPLIVISVQACRFVDDYKTVHKAELKSKAEKEP